MISTGFLYRVSLFVIMILFLISGNPGLIDIAIYAQDEKNNKKIIYLPAASICEDGKYFFNNKADYSSSIIRSVYIDFLRYDDIAVSLNVVEKSIFGSTGKSRSDPYNIRYKMDYIDIRKEFSPGSLSFFMDHICSNTINQNYVDDMKLRWYGYGLKWQSQGMRTGSKNFGIDFTNRGDYFPNNINYSVSASGKFGTVKYDYYAMLSGALRYDFFRLYNSVYYAEGICTANLGEQSSIDRSLEFGTRFRLSGIDFTPYIQYAYMNDIDIYNGSSEGFYSAGFRVETLVDENTVSGRSQYISPSLFPEMHFAYSYARYIEDRYLNLYNDLFCSIYLLSINNFNIYIDNGLLHNSQKENFGLFPRYLKYSFESGCAYMLNNLSIEGFYSYERNDEGNSYRGWNSRLHSSGLRFRSRGFKTGYRDYGIFGNMTDNELSRFNCMVTGEKVFDQINYGYDWQFEAVLRWDPLRYNLFIFYFEPAFAYMTGDQSSCNYRIETGVRYKSPVNFTIFYRHNYNNPDEGWGQDSHQNMIGIKCEI